MSTIQELQSSLMQLKEQFQSKAVFSQSELERGQEQALQKYDPNQKIGGVGIRALLISVFEKIDEKYTYSDFSGSANQWPHTPYVEAILRKPQSTIDAELNKINEDTNHQYLLDVKAAREDILPRIAEIRVQITEAELAEKDRIKRQALLDRELAKVSKELAIEAPDDNEEVASKVDADGAA